MRTAARQDIAGFGIATLRVPAARMAVRLHKSVAAVTLRGDKNRYERQIGATDEDIDALVHEFAGLSKMRSRSRRSRRGSRKVRRGSLT